MLVRGGGIVVLAGEEESTRDEHGNPRIFDWVALREVQRHTERTIQEPRRLAMVVMSEQAPESKIDDVNLDLLRRLEQRNVVERSHIRREMFTGGEYRQVMIDLADAMLAVGGGKGTYTAGVVMTELGKPVLPVDLKLGSIVEDGEGAIALLREMMSDPEPFFPNTHREAINQLALLTMDRGYQSPDRFSPHRCRDSGKRTGCWGAGDTRAKSRRAPEPSGPGFGRASSGGCRHQDHRVHQGDPALWAMIVSAQEFRCASLNPPQP